MSRVARTAQARLRRLLVMLPWLMERGSTPLAEVAGRFAATEREIVEDLELASLCGLPPYVDELIDVFIDGDTVHVGVPRLFTRPLRLTSIEAFEVLVAARAAMQLPGADTGGALARGLAKLATAIGQSSDAGVVEVAADAVRFADELTAAVAASTVVEIEYFSASSDAVGTRTVLPRQVFTDRGNWYLLAEDAEDAAGGSTDAGVRTYRIDRILECQVTDRRAIPMVSALPTPGTWFAEAGVDRAVLRIPRTHAWIFERYPVDSVVPVDGSNAFDVTLPVADERWLERLLLRAGPDVEVLEPQRWRGLGPALAEQILQRYRSGDAM